MTRDTITLKREQVEELRDRLRHAESDFEYLSGEELHGTIHLSAEDMEKWTDPAVCNGCGREVTLMGDGYCGHCTAEYHNTGQ